MSDENKNLPSTAGDEAKKEIIKTPISEEKEELSTEKTVILEEKKRHFAISDMSIDNATSIFVIIFLIIIMGFSAYTAMPKENFPEIKIPEFYIATVYPGNSPLDIENLVTRPLEKELGAISGVDEVTSTSIQDFSSIQVKFDLSVDADKALLDVKDAIDKSDIPNDLPREPNVVKLDPNNMPVMNITLSGFDDIDLLNDYAEYLQDEIERLSEVRRVDLKGVQDKEVSINVDVYEMEARQVSLYDIEEAISRENLTISGGDLLEDGLRRNVRIVGEFQSPEEIADVVIKNIGGNIYLRDVATIDYGYAETKSYSRTNQMPVVSLDVLKRTGTNLLDASDKIKEILADAEENVFPKNLKVALINDTSKQTRDMVSNLENSIISGVILVVLVLLFFLGLRNALFVGIAIPLSMLMGFMMLGFAGVTLNMMVLFSLILALGMLVDNGIVVVENIYRLMQEGMPPKQAAKEGVGEVAWPIIASTATTLAAFLPLLFWNSIWGEFMKFLPITLILVLASSLFVALVINPVLTSQFMTVEDPDTPINHKKVLLYFVVFALLSIISYFFLRINWLGSLLGIIALIILIQVYIFAPLSNLFLNNVMPLVEKAYEKFIRFALWKFMPSLFLAGTFALLIGTFYLLSVAGLKSNVLPSNEPMQVYVYAEFPIGTDIEKSNTLAKELEQKVVKSLEPYEHMVEAVMANVGEGAGDPQRPDNSTTPHKIRISIFFLEFQKRKGASTTEAMEAVRDAVQGYTDEIVITVDKQEDGPPQGPPINIEIVGDNFERLIKVSQEVRGFLEDASVAGVEELKLDITLDKPELLVNIDRERTRQFGLSTAQVAGDIRTAIFGKEISQFKDGEDEYPIMLRFNKEMRNDAEKVLNQRISFRNQNTGQFLQVPVSALVTTENGSTLGSVRRKDQERMISIYSNVVEGYNGGQIMAEYTNLLRDYEMPDGYTIQLTGQQAEEAEVANFLANALLIAVFLIFLIIVTQFNSIAMPFIIVLTVVFSTIGVFLGYIFFDMEIVVLMTGIGIISLAGIVVNNAIVLIDYTNLVRGRLRQRLHLDANTRLTTAQVVDAIVEGGATRLRPVLLTAITTILGLIPLAIGFNIDFYGLLNSFEPNIYIGGDNAIFWGAMAWTVIFGLTFSTFLTLIIVPVMYFIVDRVSSFFFGTGVNR